MELVVAVAASTAALASALFVWLQVREMRHQTRLQREIRESAAQPYVWADVRIQSTNGWNIELVVGNSGSTVATNVRVQVDPPFPRDDREGKYVDAMHERLGQGLASLAPGRTLHWTLGPSHKLVTRDGSQAHTVKIDCDGPFGHVETSEYVIDFEDFRVSVVKYAGTMQDVAKAVDKAAKVVADATRRAASEISSATLGASTDSPEATDPELEHSPPLPD